MAWALAFLKLNVLISADLSFFLDISRHLSHVTDLRERLIPVYLLLKLEMVCF